MRLNTTLATWDTIATLFSTIKVLCCLSLRPDIDWLRKEMFYIRTEVLWQDFLRVCFLYVHAGPK